MIYSVLNLKGWTVLRGKPHIYRSSGAWWVHPPGGVSERAGTFAAARRLARNHWLVGRWNAGIGRA